jgi:hypothetical protein
VSMDEICLYRYDPKTKKKSMKCRNSGSLRPNSGCLPTNSGSLRPKSGTLRPIIFECQNCLENFSPLIFGIKLASSSLIILQTAKYLTLSNTGLPLKTYQLSLERKAIEISPLFFRRVGYCSHRNLVGRTKLRIF